MLRVFERHMLEQSNHSNLFTQTVYLFIFTQVPLGKCNRHLLISCTTTLSDWQSVIRYIATSSPRAVQVIMEMIQGTSTFHVLPHRACTTALIAIAQSRENIITNTLARGAERQFYMDMAWPQPPNRRKVQYRRR